MFRRGFSSTIPRNYCSQHGVSLADCRCAGITTKDPVELLEAVAGGIQTIRSTG